MKIPSFALERYFAKYEFTTRYLLSSSDCQTMPMQELVSMASEETRALWDNLALGYTETMGLPVLRQAIAGLYPGLGPENTLVVFPGEGIFLTMNALLEKGDHVVCISPAYQSLHEVARSLGCDVSDWKLHEGNGWAPDLDELKGLLRSDTRLVVVNFPHNPTGFHPDKEFFQALLSIVEERGIYLLSDEMYRFLELDEDGMLPSACRAYSRAITLGGLSKAFGLPGLRLGWLVAQDTELLERISSIKDYVTLCHSAPSEILGIMALENRDDIISRQKTLVNSNLQALEKFLHRHSDQFACVPPKGGSICLPRMLKTDNTLDFCENLVRKTGITLVPSTMFQFGQHHVRFGFGRKDFSEVLGVFSKYLENTP